MNQSVFREAFVNGEEGGVCKQRSAQRGSWDERLGQRVPQSEEGLSGESTGLPRGAPDYNLPFCLFAFKLW